jgi:ABC-type sugar transport system ATPase subunit
MDAFEKGIAIIYQETSCLRKCGAGKPVPGREKTKKLGPMTVLDYRAMARELDGIFRGSD